MRDLIVVLDCLVNILELHHICYGSEKLVFHYLSIMADCYYRWLHVVSFLLLNISADKYLSTLFLNSFDPVPVLSDSIFSVERPKKHSLLQRVSTLYSLVGGDHLLDELVVD